MGRGPGAAVIDPLSPCGFARLLSLAAAYQLQRTCCDVIDDVTAAGSVHCL